MPEDYPPRKFYATLGPVLKELYGFDLSMLENLPERLQQLGYINVERKVFHMPLGEWPRDRYLRMLGGYFREVFLDFVAAMAARPLVEAGLDKADIEELHTATKNALNNRRVHAYVPIHFVWAQKPPA